MSLKANTRLIGAFVTVAFGLLLGLMIYFGSARLFSDNVRFVLFFDQSVNGLNLGSLVKFRGVPVGSVEEILIRAEGQSEDSSAIPVVVSINTKRLIDDLGLGRDVLSDENIEISIERGLVGSLNLESFVTGQLFVDFSYEPDKMLITTRPLKEVEGMLVIPTLGSSLDEITSDVAQIISDIGSTDIALLVDNVNRLLVSAHTFLDGLDTEGISESVVMAADTVTGVLSSKEFNQSLSSLRIALDSVAETVETYRLDDGPLAKHLADFSQTLANIDALFGQSSGLIKPNSALMVELMSTLREFGRTAQSIRMLTDFLERNPDALLKGRAGKDINE
jgi:paraquat-inducible protein B